MRLISVVFQLNPLIALIMSGGQRFFAPYWIWRQFCLVASGDRVTLCVIFPPSLNLF